MAACLPLQITSLSVANNPSWSSHLPGWETNLRAAQGLKAQSFHQEGEECCDTALNQAPQWLSWVRLQATLLNSQAGAWVGLDGLLRSPPASYPTILQPKSTMLPAVQ